VQSSQTRSMQYGRPAMAVVLGAGDLAPLMIGGPIGFIGSTTPMGRRPGASVPTTRNPRLYRHKQYYHPSSGDSRPGPCAEHAFPPRGIGRLLPVLMVCCLPVRFPGMFFLGVRCDRMLCEGTDRQGCGGSAQGIFPLTGPPTQRRGYSLLGLKPCTGPPR